MKNNKTNEHEEEIEYVTECPLYNGNGKKKVKENQFVKKEIEQDGKCVYKVDLTCYDKGERPFYASIQKNVKGGLLQRKRKLSFFYLRMRITIYKARIKWYWFVSSCY